MGCALSLKACQGEQTWDGELAKIHTLFPYIFMKCHLFTADRVLRSVSRMIYRPATPEGLYMGREGAAHKALSGRILAEQRWAAQGSSAVCVPIVDARIILHTRAHAHTSVQTATPQSSHCYVWSPPVWQFHRFNSALISSFDWSNTPKVRETGPRVCICLCVWSQWFTVTGVMM